MKLKTVFLLAFLVLAAAVFWLAQSGTSSPSAVLTFGPTEEERARFDSLTLSYTDPELGFRVRYPTGYVVNAEDGAALSFYSPTFTSLSEAHTLVVTNESFTLAELEATLKKDLLSSRKISSQELTLPNGQRAFRLQYLAEDGPYRLHVVQALVECKSSKDPTVPSYSLYYVAVIPEEVKDDVALADYVIQSVTC